jgi:hypothetical protein
MSMFTDPHPAMPFFLSAAQLNTPFVRLNTVSVLQSRSILTRPLLN